MLDFRRCGGCGTRFARERQSCPSCGAFALGFAELFRGQRLAATGGIPLLAFVIAFLLEGHYASAIAGLGLSPIVVATAWLAYRRAFRDPSSFAARITDVERRLEELDHDLEDTDRRLAAARAELDEEPGARARVLLEREVEQDRRLQIAQRRLVSTLERRLEQLEIERFRVRLAYFEACRDARVDSSAIAAELQACIRATPTERGRAWEPVLEEAQLLHRQLSRGVARLGAARRLDPFAFTDVESDPLVPPSPSTTAGPLDGETDLHLERIERGFDALEEIAAELVGDPDASGVRLRVDDDVMAALEEEVPAARPRRKRTV
ncbi:MAG: hypothetical protein KF729_33230 [Sandaracinaceae bacterium]|nr:hypothetical protein [Sandaracinaceae bacterium]